MFKWIRKIKMKIKIKWQIRLLFLFGVFIPVWLLGVFSMVWIKNQMYEHYSAQIHAESVRINSTLFDITTSIYSSTDSIVNNVNNMEMLGKKFTSTKYYDYLEQLEGTLSYLHTNTASISSIYIYTDNPYIPDSPHLTYTKDFSEEFWYDTIPEQELECWTFVHHEDRFGNEIHELCLIRKMGVVSEKYSAYLVICLDNNNLKNRLNQNGYTVTASLSDLNIFYSTDLNRINSEMLFPDDFNYSYYNYTGSVMSNEDEVLADYVTYSAYKTNDKFYICVMDYTAINSINNIIKIYIIILLIVTLIPCLLILSFTNLFSNRITTLKTAMHQASMGDYNIIDNFDGNDDELAETFKDLKTTVNMIHKKESLYYTAQINEQQLKNKQQQMEYNMLASQINPHFLYNTLETIRMQALTGNNKDVVTSIKLLGKSLRYVLDNTGNNSTTLSKEIEHVQNYLAIQHIRFGERVNSEVYVSNKCDTENIRILPLLLQPIVENSIIHGLEELDGVGLITINIDISDNLLNISIKDNGIGMDSETLERIRINMESHAANAQSIGLYNINQRVKLFYGEEYKIEINSIENEGTIVSLNIPAHL